MSDTPFLGFSYKEIPTTLMQEEYNEFVCMDDDLQVTGEQTDKELCKEAQQCSDAYVEAIDNDPCPLGNKEVLDDLSIICW